MVAALAAAIAAIVGCARAADAPPLVLEREIALPDVAGRIDHLALSSNGTRLIVGELVNHAIDVVDVPSGRVVHRIAGVAEPQGVAFDKTGALILAAERAGGALVMFDAEGFAPAGEIALGEDADNIRIDPRNGHVIIGYGDGALAVVDTATQRVLSRIPLPAHPESFQIEASGRVFVNLPDKHTIATVDLDRGMVLKTWKLPGLYNFPMALDPAAARLASVFRLPAKVALFDRESGAVLAAQATCGDSDDAFFDGRRLYVVCGAGVVDVFDADDRALKRVARVATASGARTGVFSPKLGRLFVAAPARNGRPAHILVLKRTP
jgi:sugar lactone lactonase YvrE